MAENSVLDELQYRVSLLAIQVFGERFPTLAYTVGVDSEGTRVDVLAGGTTVISFAPTDAAKGDDDLRRILSEAARKLGTGYPPPFREPMM